MDQTWCNILLLAVSLSAMSLLVSAACPYDVTNCVCTGRKVVCTNLAAVPQLKSNDSNIDTLIFSNGTLSSIPGNRLPPNLVSITFEKLPITNVSDNAFDNSAATLREINFSSLQLPELPMALLAINNLTSLTVYDTPTYNNYNNTLMEHLGKSLRTLKLMANRLSYWPEWFHYFTLLEEINLYGIVLDNSPNISLGSVASSLKSLNLTRSSMWTISGGLSGLSLTELVLSSNLLGRNISDVDNALLPSANTLQTLYLDGNLLSSIPSAISKMDKLLTLDISGNNITTIASNSFPVNLRELHLDNNKILEITDRTFPSGSQLQILYLNDNPLHVVSSLAFQPLSQLRELSLQSTDLLTIPISLTALTKLENLHLPSDSKMKCYCPRGQLVDWYRSLAHFTVSGRCDAYDSDYGYDISLYFDMGGYKLLCSGFAPLISSWNLCFMSLVVSVLALL